MLSSAKHQHGDAVGMRNLGVSGVGKLECPAGAGGSVFRDGGVEGEGEGMGSEMPCQAVSELLG